ncbi:rasp f 9, partial [Delitschia confertaspora ATCC 74209]
MHIQSLLLGALASMATAQTFTECDPTKKSCPNNPAMKEALETDFKKGVDATAGWKTTAGKINYGKDGAEFTISKKGESPTIQSNTYLFFGRIEVKMKAAAGKGIISSIVLESDDLDEVDWEFLGTDTTHVQMNYFGKGNTTVYDRMLEGSVANPQQTFHTYALDWKPEALTWEIDGVPVRTLKYADAVGGKNYPQTPSNVRIGIWAGGDPDNKEGVIQWAGGKTDYSKAPFTMVVESVKITNYNPGTEYKWKDQSGSWQSIEVLGKGDKSG